MKKAESAGADGFKLVTYKNKKKRRSRRHNCPIDEEGITDKMFTISELKKCKEELESSGFLSNIFEDLDKAFEDMGIVRMQCPEIEHLPIEQQLESLNLEAVCPLQIVCWGLGRFRSCPTARTQLAFLMLLKEKFQRSVVSIYDPVFIEKEKKFLKRLGLKVLKIDEKGRRVANSMTIFFMPHCDLPLYNNLIFANWKVKYLPNVILIGNSFSTYIRNSTEERLFEDAFYIYLCSSFVKEIKITDGYEHHSAFNDSSIHYFPRRVLPRNPKIWEYVIEPPMLEDYDVRHPKENGSD